MPILYAVVASGAVVSDDVDLRKHVLEAISVPVINSADLGVKAGFDTTSALFTRILEPRFGNSGDLRFLTYAGSRTVGYPKDAFNPPYLRLETIMATGSAQTDARTFTLLTRPR